jgi:carbon-monoxide dehydrogenase small subunit
MKVQFTLNGRKTEAEAPARQTLADFLRYTCGKTGTHVGCEHGVCGACTVLVDGKPMRSCLMLAVQAQGANVTTVEGLSDEEGLTPLQLAFKKHHGLQCGFCTPGVLTTVHALLTSEPDATEERIRDVLSGNICRCTGYVPIIESALEARAYYKALAEGAKS